MKLFFVEGWFTAPHDHTRQVHIHVHAESPAEAWKVTLDNYTAPARAYVYDVSQSALCAGVLYLDKCPREEFRA